jgi:uncharacterized protein YdcH (DUF465 family)
VEAGNVGESNQQKLERLMAEHRALKERVHQLEQHLSLTTSEQLELARLKKLKLHTKDQLWALRARC